MRRVGCLATCHVPEGKSGGLRLGLDIAAAVKTTKQNKQKNPNFILMEYVLKSRKLRFFESVGNPMVEFPELVVAPGYSHFNSN